MQIAGKGNDFRTGVKHHTADPVFAGSGCQPLETTNIVSAQGCGGFAALLRLEEPGYSIEQIAAKCAKSPSYVLARIRLTELSPAVTEAFLKDEIGTGHALLLAKLQPAQQEEALTACYQEQFGNGNKSKRILLPVRQLQQWIEGRHSR